LLMGRPLRGDWEGQYGGDCRQAKLQFPDHKSAIHWRILRAAQTAIDGPEHHKPMSYKLRGRGATHGVFLRTFSSWG
jgi:hypothetical protein